MRPPDSMNAKSGIFPLLPGDMGGDCVPLAIAARIACGDVGVCESAELTDVALCNESFETLRRMPPASRANDSNSLPPLTLGSGGRGESCVPTRPGVRSSEDKPKRRTARGEADFLPSELPASSVWSDSASTAAWAASIGGA